MSDDGIDFQPADGDGIDFLSLSQNLLLLKEAASNVLPDIKQIGEA